MQFNFYLAVLPFLGMNLTVPCLETLQQLESRKSKSPSKRVIALGTHEIMIEGGPMCARVWFKHLGMFQPVIIWYQKMLISFNRVHDCFHWNLKAWGFCYNNSHQVQICNPSCSVMIPARCHIDRRNELAEKALSASHLGKVSWLTSSS